MSFYIIIPKQNKKFIDHLQHDGKNNTEITTINIAGINEYPIKEAKHASVIPSSPHHDGVSAMTIHVRNINDNNHKIANLKINVNIQFHIRITKPSSDDAIFEVIGILRQNLIYSISFQSEILRFGSAHALVTNTYSTISHQSDGISPEGVPRAYQKKPAIATTM